MSRVNFKASAPLAKGVNGGGEKNILNPVTKVLGIDLGTTYSRIALVDEDRKPKIIPNDENERITPSVVFFDEDNVIVGNEAKSNSVLYPDQVVAFVKPFMGDPNFVFEYNGGSYKPEEISSFILRKLVGDAEQTTGTKINDVVITCPAYFGVNEREATKIAGELAGLNVLRIINEPTAAAIAYGMAEDNEKKVVLVYDLGSGTFDISMLEITPDAIEVICADGDHRLGGNDWDDTVTQYLAAWFQEENGIPGDILENREFCETLLQAAEKAKKTLSSFHKARIPIVFRTRRSSLELSREKFDEITGNLLDRTVSLTRDVLEEAKKKGYHTFDEILLTGGSVRMPQVRERINKEFSIEPKLFGPDDAAAKGAALYGWSLSAAHQFAVKNLCSKSFGLVVMNIDKRESVVNVIKKNTEVPVVFTKKFATSDANVENFSIRIAENEVSGETAPLEYAIEIGELHLSLPPGLPAGSPIEVTFSLNEEGRLDITALESTGNRAVALTVETNAILQGEALEEAQKAKTILEKETKGNFNGDRDGERYKKLDEIIEIAGSDGIVSTGEFDFLIAKAGAMGLKQEEAKEYIDTYCRKKKWVVEIAAPSLAFKLNAEAGAVITKLGGEAQLQVKLLWKNTGSKG